MSKSKAKPAPQAEESESTSIIPIRTETILSQYPLHRLAKRTEQEIAVTRTNARGKIISTWEVSPSKKYGEPGPLAYKLDTLLVNRAIDEARPHIPEIIRLGSLREICAALGLSADTNTIKKALLQNASAFITAKLEYKGVDGAEKTFEFGATRYEVVFLGQRLPNGQKADAVFIILHRTYRDFLEHAKTRPLDYEYLKALPPAAQRLYELISFQIFAALKNGNSRARYLYSDFCRYAPLTRYEDWERVKKQLYKVHKPHKDSGYIRDVEYAEIADDAGRPDWIMWYTPGEKARNEYREFTTKRMERTAARPTLVSSVERREGNWALVERLTGEGVTETIARELVQEFAEEVERQLDALPFRERLKDRPAYLVKAIRDRYSLPADLDEKKGREGKQRRFEQARANEREREAHREKYVETYFEYLRAELTRLEASNPDALAEFAESFEELEIVARKLKPQGREALRLAAFEEFAMERAELLVLSFWGWDEKLNPTPLR